MPFFKGCQATEADQAGHRLKAGGEQLPAAMFM